MPAPPSFAGSSPSAARREPCVAGASRDRRPAWPAWDRCQENPMTLWRLTASELADQVRARAVSAREVAQDALDRLDAVNPAHQRRGRAPARRGAGAGRGGRRRAGARRRPGTARRRAGDRSRSMPTSRLRDHQRRHLQRDLVAAERQPGGRQPAQGGAVLLGRTNTPAFSLRWFTDQPAARRDAEPARSGADPGRARPAGPARPSPPASARWPTAPTSPAPCATRPMPAACTACARASAGSRPGTPPRRSAASARS